MVKQRGNHALKSHGTRFPSGSVQILFLRKRHDYLTDMLEESVTLANSTGQGNLQREDKVDRIHVLAPEERPARQEIIKKRLEMSRF